VKAARIHSFGSPDVVAIEDVTVPSPGHGEVLVRVMAAGVAPWDAIIREGKSKVSPQPPLTLGSDFSGVVEKVGPGVTDFAPTDEVYGVTNPQFCGAQAEFAVATAGMVARKPQSLNYVEAASAPVIQDCPRDRATAVVRICAARFVVPRERNSDFLLADVIFPPGRCAQDESRSPLRQRLMQPASRFRNGYLQPRKLPASSSRAFAGAGREATFEVRLPEPDPGPVP
jgi:Alcohol dehydrogenase GroES-like domain